MSLSDRFNFDDAALSQMENIRRIGQRKLRNRADLDDFVQETLLRAYSKQHQLRDAEKFDRWIAAIARNLAREWNRKKREEPMEDIPELIDWRTPHDAVEEAERNRRLHQAMESLSRSDRELLRARYMEDASYAELQARHGLSYSAVALRIHRAKKRLRKIFKSIGAALVFVFGGFKRAAWGGVLLVSNTTKIVGTAVALAAAAALWMLLSGREPADERSAPDAAQSPRLDDSPLRPEDQTPRFIPEVEEEASGAANPSTSETPEVKSSKPPVELLSWDDAMGECARITGVEYDALIQILPKQEAMNKATDAMKAKIEHDPEYAYVWEALKKYYHQQGANSSYDPRYPAWYDFHPAVLLVRSGRLDPDEMPHQKRTLPNGQVIRMLPHEKYIIKFRKRRVYSEEQLQFKETLLQKQADLQARLSGASSESDTESLRSELEEIQRALEVGFKPFTEFEREHMWGRENDPNLKVYELDLGEIDIDHSMTDIDLSAIGID